jgi:prevent-host-death family protein
MQITISTDELESRCDELIDHVETNGLTVVITKNNQPIAKLMPITAEAEPFGSILGSVVSEGDIISPIEGVWDLKELADPGESAQAS